MVIRDFNSLLHKQAGKWSTIGDQPESLVSLDIPQVIRETDPQLWKIVWSMTTSKRGSWNSSETAQMAQRSDITSHRTLPCIFLLSAMAHLARPPCHYPFSLVVADYVDSHSQSSDLLLLLSRLGVCSSRDTHQRLKTMVVKKRYDEGLQKDLALEAFAVTSIDNIDRTAPGKRITSRSQSWLSWHKCAACVSNVIFLRIMQKRTTSSAMFHYSSFRHLHIPM